MSSQFQRAKQNLKAFTVNKSSLQKNLTLLTKKQISSMPSMGL